MMRLACLLAALWLALASAVAAAVLIEGKGRPEKTIEAKTAEPGTAHA